MAGPAIDNDELRHSYMGAWRHPGSSFRRCRTKKLLYTDVGHEVLKNLSVRECKVLCTVMVLPTSPQKHVNASN